MKATTLGLWLFIASATFSNHAHAATKEEYLSRMQQQLRECDNVGTNAVAVKTCLSKLKSKLWDEKQAADQNYSNKDSELSRLESAFVAKASEALKTKGKGHCKNCCLR